MATKNKNTKSISSDTFLTFLATILTAIGIIVAAYFGWLAIRAAENNTPELSPVEIETTKTTEANLTTSELSLTPPPSDSPISTITPLPTATPTIVATPNYLFSDDFENGTSQWEIPIPNIWKIERQANNNFLCVISSENYAYALAGSETWGNYTLMFDMLIDKSYTSSVPLFGTRFGDGRKYEVIVSNSQSDIYKSVFSPTFNSTWLNKSVHSTFIDSQWYSFKFSVNKDRLTVSSDSRFNIEYSDNDFFSTGKIELGASPNSRVCFDNVQVMAIP